MFWAQMPKVGFIGHDLPYGELKALKVNFGVFYQISEFGELAVFALGLYPG